MTLDPQAAAFLERMAQDHAPPLHEMSVEQVRSLLLPIAGDPENVGGVLSESVPMAAGDVPIRVYTPMISTEELDAVYDPNRGRPMLLFFHGGGWVAGCIETHDAVCRRLTNESRCLVISVDYRLAPEHKFPAALDDCTVATRWAYDQAEHLGGDSQRVYLCGDSAGGNLAAAVCLRAAAESGPPIRGQILVYPATDHRCDTESYRVNGTGYHLTAENMKWFWSLYLADDSQGTDPYASPLRASDLSGLPATLVVTAEYDPLRDEGLAYADRLVACDVAVERISCEGMVHGFFRRLDSFDRASQLVTEIAEWLHADVVRS